ncbi:immunoglobulin A1 protease autotransporter isoform X2 [Synchiropus splendidus]|uniref:immunoglobulin A1 protease autotransporter isoform X2 n=1 Tax=Synchiropus splendidus TaxID=270530 RepID=UPI00237E5E4A|nr:immunoglobulin A1 protease autotransporter isoform X2 [Synchiropus splendidus]
MEEVPAKLETTMFACRSVWVRCGSLARSASYRRPRDVLQLRQMSSAPGGSGENIVYTVLCAGAFVGAMSYAYSTVTSDSARYNERIAEISSRPKTVWTPKPWPPMSEDEDTGGDVEDEVVAEAPSEEEAESVLETEGTTITGEVAEVPHNVDTVVEVPQAEAAVEKAEEPIPTSAEEPEINAVLSIDSSVAATKEVLTLDVLEEDEAGRPVSVAKNITEETPVLLPVVEEASIETPPKTHNQQESQSLVEVSSVGSETVVDLDLVDVMLQVEVPVERVPDSEAVPVEAAPITEESSVEVAPEALNATVNVKPLLEVSPVHMFPVAAEVPVEMAQVSEELPINVAPLMTEVTIDVPQMVQEVPGEETGMANETCPQIPPVAEEAPINVTQVVAMPSADVPSANEVVAMQDTPTEQQEYIVVVLEGKPKAEPKVLGVGPLTGSIAEPDDKASEGKRSLLRMQMQ